MKAICSERRGATLIELMITCGVFSFIVIALFALTRDGTEGWKSVDARSAVQSALRNFERDITTELRRTSLTSIRIWNANNNTSDSYRTAIVMKSATSSPVDPNDPNVPSPLGAAAYPESFFVENTTNEKYPKPNWQRWVLYYLTRPGRDQHMKEYGFLCSSYDKEVNPDYKCPHKWLVRKDISYVSTLFSTKEDLVNGDKNGTSGKPFLDGTGGWGGELNEEELKRAHSGEGGTQTGSLVVLAPRILAKNILTLRIGVEVDAAGMPTEPVISFDVKAFKVLETQRTLAIGQADLDTDTSSYTTKTDQAGLSVKQYAASGENSAYTVQLDNKVIPMNP